MNAGSYPSWCPKTERERDRLRDREYLPRDRLLDRESFPRDRDRERDELRPILLILFKYIMITKLILVISLFSQNLEKFKNQN